MLDISTVSISVSKDTFRSEQSRKKTLKQILQFNQNIGIFLKKFLKFIFLRKWIFTSSLRYAVNYSIRRTADKSRLLLVRTSSWWNMSNDAVPATIAIKLVDFLLTYSGDQLLLCKETWLCHCKMPIFTEMAC